MIRTWHIRALCETFAWGNEARKSPATSAIASDATGLEHNRSETSMDIVVMGCALE
jgi:hypothetical protein